MPTTKCIYVHVYVCISIYASNHVTGNLEERKMEYRNPGKDVGIYQVIRHAPADSRFSSEMEGLVSKHSISRAHIFVLVILFVCLFLSFFFVLRFLNIYSGELCWQCQWSGNMFSVLFLFIYKKKTRWIFYFVLCALLVFRTTFLKCWGCCLRYFSFCYIFLLHS